MMVSMQATVLLHPDHSRVTEQISESHDGVFSVLDQMRLGTVANVLW